MGIPSRGYRMGMPDRGYRIGIPGSIPVADAHTASYIKLSCRTVAARTSVKSTIPFN